MLKRILIFVLVTIAALSAYPAMIYFADKAGGDVNYFLQQGLTFLAAVIPGIFLYRAFAPRTSNLGLLAAGSVAFSLCLYFASQFVTLLFVCSVMGDCI